MRLADASADDAEELKGSIADLQSKLDSANRSKADVEQRLVTSKADNASLELEVSELTSKFSDVQTKLQDAMLLQEATQQNLDRESVKFRDTYKSYEQTLERLNVYMTEVCFSSSSSFLPCFQLPDWHAAGGECEGAN